MKQSLHNSIIAEINYREGKLLTIGHTYITYQVNGVFMKITADNLETIYHSLKYDRLNKAYRSMIKVDRFTKDESFEDVMSQLSKPENLLNENNINRPAF